MRLIAEVRGGKLAGTKRAAEPGGVITVGRTDRADLVVGHDRKLSAVHFELAWDGKTAHVRDRSQTGMLLGGRQVGYAEVEHGGWIRAGDSDFMVYREGQAKGDPAGHRRAALRLLRSQTEPLYALADAARDDRVLSVLREAVEEYRSLYEGEEAEPLAEAAPQLVCLRADSPLLDRLIEEGWGRRWCSFFTSTRPLKDVRRHLRRFLMVELPDGQPVYFRFYDPWVLRTYLGTCNDAERAAFTSELGAVIVEDGDGSPRMFAKRVGP